MRRTNTSFARLKNASRSSGCRGGKRRSWFLSRKSCSAGVAAGSSITDESEASAAWVFARRPRAYSLFAYSLCSRRTLAVPEMPALKRTTASASSTPRSSGPRAAKSASNFSIVVGCLRSCRMCALPALSGSKRSASSHHSHSAFPARRSASPREVTPANQTGRSGSSIVRAFGSSAEAASWTPSARRAARRSGSARESRRRVARPRASRMSRAWRSSTSTTSGEPSTAAQTAHPSARRGGREGGAPRRARA